MSTQTPTALFGAIYDATYRKIRAYITAKCCNTADISDILQETYCELFSVLSSRPSYNIENPEAFVMKLAKSRLARYYSYAERHRAVSLTMEDDTAEYDISDADSFCVEDSVITKELISDIHSYIAKKDECTKKIFVLFYSLDYTIPQIAGLLEISESAVKNKLYRTLIKLREQYTQGE